MTLSRSFCIVLVICTSLLLYSAKEIMTSNSAGGPCPSSPSEEGGPPTTTEAEEAAIRLKEAASGAKDVATGTRDVATEAPWHPAVTVQQTPARGHKMALPSFLSIVSELQKNTARGNIYLLVTSPPTTLKLRHYCSLESYCLHNPSSRVWLLFLGLSSLQGEEVQLLQRLQERRPNLRLAGLDLMETLLGTPLEDLVTSGALHQSKYLVHHLSDVVRLAVVWWGGGLYTDFDFIALTSVEDLRNTVALARPGALMNGLFHFDAGHPLLELLLEEGARHFNGKLWTENGPTLFTNTLRKYCGDLTSLMNNNVLDVLAKRKHRNRKSSLQNSVKYILPQNSTSTESRETVRKDFHLTRPKVEKSPRLLALRRSASSNRLNSITPS